MPPPSSSPTPIRITDVSPRDGLQNESTPIPTTAKLALIEHLLACNLDEIEVSSFVSAKWIPQLGDAAELFALLNTLLTSRPNPNPNTNLNPSTPLFSALVPNEKGLAAALEVNHRAGRPLIGKVSVFTAASETFCSKNINATIRESIERFNPVVKAAHEQSLLVRGYISCIIACPFEGTIAPAKVLEVCRMLADAGVDELDLGDTIGAGTPATTRALLQALTPHFNPSNPSPPTPPLPLTYHAHDTFNTAAACIIEALAHGIRSFDSSAGGLGGCPYASKGTSRAPGNISTSLLIQTLIDAGYQPGLSAPINAAALDAASAFALSLTHRA